MTKFVNEKHDRLLTPYQNNELTSFPFLCRCFYLAVMLFYYIILNENPKPVPCNKKCPNAIRNFTDRQHEVALSDLLRKSWL